MAKKVGLSFDELNQLTMNDFMAFIDMYIGDSEEKSATQSDIDRFYSR